MADENRAKRASEKLSVTGVRLQWADMGIHWSGPARELIESGMYLRVQLGFIALHMSTSRACMLLYGYEDQETRVRIAPDALAADSCPIDPRRVRSFAQRVERIRDQIVHLADGLEEGRRVHVEGKQRRLTISVVGKKGRVERMTDAEVSKWLDALVPWLTEQRARLLKEREAETGASKVAFSTDVR